MTHAALGSHSRSSTAPSKPDAPTKLNLVAPGFYPPRPQLKRRVPIHGILSTMGDQAGLVLGGGGVAGIAWEIGMIAGLAEEGVDLASADVVVGTSAGSLVGAQIASGAPIEDLYAHQLADPGGRASSTMSRGALIRFLVAAAWPGDERRGRAWLGRAALAAKTVPESSHLDFFISKLGATGWPSSRLLITAVEAQTGEPAVFNRESNVDLVRAVAASCAVPMVFPPITINGRRYVDGGVRSIANADLATGCRRVVVLAPVAFGIRRRQRIPYQLASLGPDLQSVVITADADAGQALGTNPLDWGRRAAAARAGHDQARRVVDRVRAVWAASATRAPIA